jgi:hypothetical protein
MNTFLLAMGVVCASVLLGAGLLHLLPRLGSVGRAVGGALCRAPWLDVPIVYFTSLPLVFGPVWGGWWGADGLGGQAWVGLAGAVAGQVSGVVIWGWLHELANPHARRGPRIVRTLNRIVGKWRNHAALWVTAMVTPVFVVVRVAQVLIYPWLSLLVGLPRYKQGEWVNVSRQKFSGLVGHDLIWCLYCDWMTGVWSLGSEMLRNVESFWCPIRFYDGKKCENCKIDFPDVVGAWVRPDGTMGEVTALLEEKYAGGNRGWFGHATRLTHEGREVGSTAGGGSGKPGA